MRFVKSIVIYALILVAITACNSGTSASSLNNNNSNNGGNSIPDTSHNNSSQYILNPCLLGSVSANGLISLNNICSTAQDINQATVAFVSEDVDGNNISFTSANSTTGNLSIEFNDAGANRQIGYFSSSNASLIINPNQQINFNSTFSLNTASSFNNSVASSTFRVYTPMVSINTPADESEPETDFIVDDVSYAQFQTASSVGKLTLKINTSKAGCGVSTDCTGLFAQVNDESGHLVHMAVVPSNAYGKTYSTTIQNLAPGRYIVTVPGLSNTTHTNNNPTPTVQAKKTTTSTITYNTTIGSVKVTVNSSKASCGTGANCTGMGAAIVDAVTGVVIESFTVPSASFNKSYTTTLTGIPAGSYKVVANPIENTQTSYVNNGNITVVAQKTASTTVTYATTVTTGSANISLPMLVADDTVELPLTIINTASDNQVVYSGVIAQGSSVIISGIEATTKNAYAYKVCVPVGFADPQKGDYFVQKSCQSISITKNKTTNLKLNMTKNPVARVKVDLEVSGLNTGDVATTFFNDAVNKYEYKPLADKDNGTYSVYLEKKSNVTLSTDADVTVVPYTTNPVKNSVTVTGTGNLKATFSDATVGAALNVATSYDYANNTIVNIPVGSFGLISYVVTNTTDSTMSGMIFPEDYTYPQDVFLDVTRTTCMCPTCSPLRSESQLAPEQSCTVVLKYQPAASGTVGSFNFYMRFSDTDNTVLATPVVTIPFASRGN